MLTDHFAESAAAEVALVYRTVRHNQSYNSLNCTTKLLSVVFKEPPAAKHIRCGRMKSSKIVSQVLAPEAPNRYVVLNFMVESG